MGEWRSSGERKYYLSNLPPGTSRRALGLRAGSPAAQRRTRPGSLRGTVLDWAASPRADDAHRLRLPAAPPPRRTSSRDCHRRQVCPPCGRPSSDGCSPASSRPSCARTVESASSCPLTSKCPGSDSSSRSGRAVTAEGREGGCRSANPAPIAENNLVNSVNRNPRKAAEVKGCGPGRVKMRGTLMVDRSAHRWGQEEEGLGCIRQPDRDTCPPPPTVV